MPRHQKSSSKKTGSLIQRLKDFVGKEGGFYSYSLSEGSLDASDEDRYEIAFHEAGSLITFSRAWSLDELIVPLHSKRFLAILRFLKQTDDELRAATLDPLILSLEKALRHGKSHVISGITIAYRKDLPPSDTGDSLDCF